jgi:hypothetical protein
MVVLIVAILAVLGTFVVAALDLKAIKKLK